MLTAVFHFLGALHLPFVVWVGIVLASLLVCRFIFRSGLEPPEAVRTRSGGGLIALMLGAAAVGVWALTRHPAAKAAARPATKIITRTHIVTRTVTKAAAHHLPVSGTDIVVIVVVAVIASVAIAAITRSN